MNEKESHLEMECLSQFERKKYFPYMKIQEIRNRLEKWGYYRHIPIEYSSTEVCIITPQGILLQIRVADKGALGMWGGLLEDGEELFEGVNRVVLKETGIDLSKRNIHFVEMNSHYHCYGNGDRVKFITYRFVVKLNEVPNNISLDNESMGYVFVNNEEECESVLPHQKEFIKRMLNK